MRAETELSARFLNMLGLCARAGRCQYGETACLNAIRADRAFMVLVDAGASDNTRKRFGDACAYRQLPLLLYEKEKNDAAHAVGKPSYKVIAVCDEGFASRLAELAGHGSGDATGNLGVEA